MNSTPMKLLFPFNDTGEMEGLSDAGIETFKENAYSSAARESAQNSRDAGVAFPVRVHYDLIYLRHDQLPDFDALQSAIVACEASNAKLKDLKARQFFSKALNTLALDSIPALRISDYGTKGLVGPCEPGKPFHALVKSSGVTNKGDPTSGGSFGIGKRAAFAISNLHTVFYSTVYDSGSSMVFLAQGKCTLTSHTQNSSDFRATGYFGQSGYLPIAHTNQAPDWLRREEVGTTTVSVGFDVTDGWQFRIAESLARNFVGAIQSGQLEFSIDNNSIVLNKSNIYQRLSSPELKDSAAHNNAITELELAKQVYECLTSPKSDHIESWFPSIGRLKLHILLGEGLPQRVAILRNGMFVTDNLSSFGEKFSNFPSYKDFVAVIEPADDAASATMKRLENPSHNSFSSDRIVDLEERAAIKKSMETVGKWARDEIKKLAHQPPKSVSAVDELNEFFAEPGIADTHVAESSDLDPERLVFRARKPTKRPANPDYSGQGDDESDGGGAPGKNAGTWGNGGGSGSGKGVGAGGAVGESLSFEELRSMPDPSELGGGRILLFTPNVSGKAQISIVAKGMNNDSVIGDVEFVDGEKGPVIDLVAGTRKKLHIRFKSDYAGPINITLRKHEPAGEKK